LASELRRERARRRFVAGEAGGRDLVVARRYHRRVGGDGDGGSTCRGQRVAKAVEDGDRTEEIDRDDGGAVGDVRSDPRAGDDTVEPTIGEVKDSAHGLDAAVERTEVGLYLGTTEIDADDARAAGLEPPSHGGSDARARPRDRECAHDGRVSTPDSARKPR